MYPFCNREVKEEDANPEHPLKRIESLFQNSEHFDTTILRLAGTFGGQRHPGRFFRSGKTVKNPDSPVNLIHLEDCINLIGSIVQQNAWNEVFNGCTDSHPSKREFYSFASQNAGIDTPTFSSDSNQVFKIVSNEKVKTKLGFCFSHPDLMQSSFKD